MMKKSTLWITLSLGIIVILSLSSYFGFQAFKNYKIGRYNGLATEALSKGNWNLSRFWYAKSLEIDPLNVEALTQLARGANFYQDPEGVNWWKQLTLAKPDANDAKFGYIEALLRTQQLDEAKAVLEGIQPSTEENPKFLNLQTAYCIAVQDMDQAEILARKSVEAKEDSVELKLNLLNILLQKGNPESRDEINEIMTNVSADQTNLPKLWRVLLGYSLGRKNWDESLKIAENLAKHPQAQWQEKVAYLKLLVKLDAEKVSAFLNDIKSPPTQMIEELSRVFNQIGYSELMLNWLDGLLEAGLDENLSVQIAKADAYNSLKQWDHLITYVIAKDWGFFDYYRHLLLCRAYMDEGKNLESNREWSNALKKAKKAGIQEEGRMAQLLEQWPEFEPQWLSLLEEMLKDAVHARWAYNKLQSYYYNQGATQQLYHMSQIVRRSLPDDTGILNNYIMQGLLLREDLPGFLVLAQQLSDAYPGKPIPTSTYAFALFQNGKKEEAYALIKGLDERFFNIAEIAHYAAVIAKGAGDEAAAAEFREKAKNASLLPEEKALLDG